MTTEELYREIGTLVRSARERIGFTQFELAQAVGLTRTSISNLESGRQKIQVHTLFNIAETLDVSMDSLLPSSKSKEEKLGEHLKDLDENERDWVKRILDR